MPKTKKSAKPAKLAVDGDIARKIWLAGVGAYGRMFNETQEAVEKFAGSASEAFDHLVARGEAVEDKVRDSIARSTQGGKVAAMVGSAQARVKTFSDERRAVLDARIEKVRKSVTETLAPLNVTALAAAVEKLSAKVESLSSDVAAMKGPKAPPAPRKAATKAKASA